MSMPRSTKKSSNPARSRKNGGARPSPLESAQSIEHELAQAPSRVERRARTRGGAARTASGKKSDPQLLAAAALGAQEGLRERTEAGHLWAGRTPPSQQSTARGSGATRVVDDSIRSYIGPVTEDQKLLQAPSGTGEDFTRTDPWRVMRIMGEFIEGFDNLASVDRGVTIFGSARTHPEDP